LIVSSLAGARPPSRLIAAPHRWAASGDEVHFYTVEIGKYLVAADPLLRNDDRDLPRASAAHREKGPQMFRRVLVAFDASRHAQAALVDAIELGVLHSSPVPVLVVRGCPTSNDAAEHRRHAETAARLPA
jgi:hypothetical protein